LEYRAWCFKSGGWGGKRKNWSQKLNWGRVLTSTILLLQKQRDLQGAAAYQKRYNLEIREVYPRAEGRGKPSLGILWYEKKERKKFNERKKKGGGGTRRTQRAYQTA